MTDFVNTRDVLTDDITLRKLVDGSLEELNEDGITTLCAYGLYNSSLINVNMPNLVTIKEYGFAGSKSLENITMNKLKTLGQYGFSGCSSLKTVNAPLLETVNGAGFKDCTSLTSINLPNLVSMNNAPYCFVSCKNLTSINLPKVTILPTECFRNNVKLKNISIPKVSKINNADTFMSCYNLHTIDLSNTQDLININTTNFRRSGIKNIIIRSPRTDNTITIGNLSETYFKNNALGSIYILDDLVDTYKTRWPSVANCIYPISSYPRTEFGTITDTWEEIFAAEEDGSYETKYNIGDTKAVEIDGDYIMMEIIAMNTDVRADESDIAKITWLSTEGIYNDKNPYDWPSSNLRNYLNNDFYNTINNTIKNKIVKVKKFSKVYVNYGTYAIEPSEDFIWIPSAYEISSDSSYENLGRVYPSLCNQAARTKSSYNVSSNWWTRTAGRNSNTQVQIDTIGNLNNNTSATYSFNVVFGFCT